MVHNSVKNILSLQNETKRHMHSLIFFKNVYGVYFRFLLHTSSEGRAISLYYHFDQTLQSKKQEGRLCFRSMNYKIPTIVDSQILPKTVAQTFRCIPITTANELFLNLYIPSFTVKFPTSYFPYPFPFYSTLDWTQTISSFSVTILYKHARILQHQH